MHLGIHIYVYVQVYVCVYENVYMHILCTCESACCRAEDECTLINSVN